MSTTIGHTRSSGQPRVRLGKSGGGFDAAVAERVRLYLKVTFYINLMLSVVVVITRLTDEVAAQRDMPWAVFGVTALNGLAWFLVARSRGSASSSPQVASVTTLFLAAAYTHVAMSTEGDPNPTRTGFFLLLILAMVLVLRSSLIASRTMSTVVVGAISVAFPIYASRAHAVGPDAIFFTWMVAAGLIVVVVTAVTSGTIYGLDRKMRAAAQLGQYKLERPLGRGGMGEVYLAEHALLHRPTAVKLLRDVASAASRDLFRQEVQTASGLTHPNTVEIFDYGRTPDGVFYFAMEYVEGATLEEVVLATGAMPPSRVIHLLTQAAGSLGEAHERGLVHRDVKPSNLMLCERGGIFDTLKVMDFGLVRDLAEDEGQAERGLTGTPLYLAPEAILEADGATPQSDVYALGATAFFMLTGAPPFEGESLVEILSDHLAADPPDFDCDDDRLAALVKRCLAKDPHERPADARELATALEACAAHGAWKARDASIWWTEHREVVDAYKPQPEELQDASGRASRQGTSRSRARTTAS